MTFLARINRQETSFTNANLKKSQKDVRFNESVSFNWWRQGSQTDPTLTNQSQKAFICVWSCLPHCFENIPRVGDCIMIEHQNQICGCQICWFGGYQNRKMQSILLKGNIVKNNNFSRQSCLTVHWFPVIVSCVSWYDCLRCMFGVIKRAKSLQCKKYCPLCQIVFYSILSSSSFICHDIDLAKNGSVRARGGTISKGRLLCN